MLILLQASQKQAALDSSLVQGDCYGHVLGIKNKNGDAEVNNCHAPGGPVLQAQARLFFVHMVLLTLQFPEVLSYLSLLLIPLRGVRVGVKENSLWEMSPTAWRRANSVTLPAARGSDWRHQPTSGLQVSASL